MDEAIPDFRSWLASDRVNGYFFQSGLRLKPGCNNAFFYKPLSRPLPGSAYFPVLLYEQQGDHFVPCGEERELFVPFCLTDRAFPAPPVTSGTT